MNNTPSNEGQAVLTDSNDFPQRLKQAVGENSIRGFARSCGFSDTVLRQYLNGQSEPTRPALLAIARTANVSVEWLAGGQPGHNSLGDGESKEYIYKDPLAFQTDWLKSEFPKSYDHLLLTQVQDESMEPTLVLGDLVLVDTRVRELAAIDHGLFLFKLNERILIKRLQYIPENNFRVLSDNPAYEAFSLDLSSKANGLSIMGRVVWAGHKL
ncbi:LexA family transcriptional regulator [Nodosilinea sp. E11]|uniref:XRE family transcriptional regulator n=1 Tax=Nodosilinea sp. E11 TaxID=3037479 RepID=UPI0029347A9A|nr:LexA family transcriptional regulator [Nodosilinea sp. E11]WOD39862.1 LexA family transcriptional regulator [Nodosilinea sp. E11]